LSKRAVWENYEAQIDARRRINSIIAPNEKFLKNPKKILDITEGQDYDTSTIKITEW